MTDTKRGMDSLLAEPFRVGFCHLSQSLIDMVAASWPLTFSLFSPGPCPGLPLWPIPLDRAFQWPWQRLEGRLVLRAWARHSGRHLRGPGFLPLGRGPVNLTLGLLLSSCCHPNGLGETRPAYGDNPEQEGRREHTAPQGLGGTGLLACALQSLEQNQSRV